MNISTLDIDSMATDLQFGTERGFLPLKNACAFCNLSSQMARHPQSIWDTILVESENFLVVPSKGAMLEGWLLIVPRSHYLCLGALPESLFQELKAFSIYIASLLSRLYHPVSIFEHGPSTETSALGCGVNHAHLHIVPLNFSLTAASEAHLRAPRVFSQEDFWRDQPVKRLFLGGTDHLWLKEPGCPVNLWGSPPQTSQFFRKAIASSLGIPDKFNYREYPFESNTLDTIRRLQREIRQIGGHFSYEKHREFSFIQNYR